MTWIKNALSTIYNRDGALLLAVLLVAVAGCVALLAWALGAETVRAWVQWAARG